MKYVVDIDSLAECLDCLDCIKVNNVAHISLPLLKEFIKRFPADKVKEEMMQWEVEITD